MPDDEDAVRAYLLAGTSSSGRTLDSRDLAALRPAAPRRTRRVPKAPPRTSAPASEVSGGIACFCGKRFSESQALEFMLHLRAEAGADLALLAKVRQWRAATYQRRAADPAYREQQATRRAARRADPATRQRDAASRRAREQQPAARERRREAEQARRADPARRARRNAAQQARREGTGQPCGCGCGEKTRSGREYRPGHHKRIPGSTAGRQRDEVRVAQARQLYGEGLSAAAVAARFGVNPTTVQRWLAGEMRAPGAPPPSGDRDDRILELRDRGLSFAAIAGETGMSKTGARMRYYALTGRPRPDRQKQGTA